MADPILAASASVSTSVPASAEANPMGLMGFEFVEFAAPVAGVLEPLFERMGFSLVARHRSKDVV
ncbi:MAG: 4-hydroxyphenylpyruvate dioxygenase, partial [Pseudomonadota bacterium]|nr:4-hydroxyphenylpyruvate dioxygenase [Pseudomonadota bacterium]